ncbi:flagellar hook-associated protein FlgK [bacterium]|nr:flagellar hook-associated protein FlgK [bacterium]
MSNLFSILNLGVRSLSAQQTAVNIFGNNIANVNTPNYTRQAPVLAPGTPARFGLLQLGTGADIVSIRQYRDQYAVSKVNLHKCMLAYSSKKYSMLSEIEQSLASQNAQHLGESLTEFWQGFEQVGNSPEGGTERQNLVQVGKRLASSIRGQYTTLRNQRSFANEEVGQIVDMVNQLCEQISGLNAGVMSSAGQEMSQANELIDRRSELLDQLATFIDFRSVDDGAGGITVFTGDNRMLISKGEHNSLEVIQNSQNSGYYDVYWTDGSQHKNITDHISGGKLGANIESRDVTIVSYMDQLDEMTTTLLRDVNRAVSKGYAQRARQSATGTYAVYSSTVALNDAVNLNGGSNLAYDSEAGTFNILITQDGETVQNLAVTVDPDSESLQDIVNSINSGASHLTASISFNRLQITSDEGYEFVLGEDQGGVLAQLGLNTFFTGFDAYDIDVAQGIVDDPTLIAAGGLFSSGDGGNALLVSNLADALVLNSGTASFDDYFSSMVTRAGHEVSSADFELVQEEDSLVFYQNLRDQTSGVNTDEEMTNLIMFQQAYNGTAQFIATVRSMIDTIMQKLG